MLLLALTGATYTTGCGEYEERIDKYPEALPATKAFAEISPLTDRNVEGTIVFEEKKDFVKISGTINGLTEGKHGFHVHTGMTCDEPGGHFAPKTDEHGAPTEQAHHLGDLGNLVADSTGTARYEMMDDRLSLNGPQSIVGRALIVHAGEDGFNPQPSGDSGTKIGCGVIELR